MIWLMRRSALVAVIVLIALGSAGVTIAALVGAFDSHLGEYGGIFVVGRDGSGLRQLTHDQRFHDNAWSPDGRWIAMTTRSADAHGLDVPGPLELARASTARVQDVFLGGFGSDVAWRSNSSIELLLTRSHREVVSTRLVDVGLEGTVRAGAWIGPVGAAAWTPDASALAIVACDRAHGRFSIDVLSPSGRLRRRLRQPPGALPEGTCEDPDAPGELLWAPDGRSLYVGLSTGLWRLPLNGTAPRRILTEVAASEPALSPDGRQFVVGLSRTRAGNTGELLYLLPAAGGRARLLTSEFASGPTWSPDGRVIAFVPREEGEVIKTIRSSSATATALTRFPEAKTQLCCLSWSPRGMQLAFDASAKPPED
jgi:dipeptidyl aminopeptidase/acylaminoacyl peptidase